MAKRLNHLHNWHWHGHAAAQPHTPHFTLHRLALPLFVLAALLLLDGALSLSLSSLAIGALSLGAALGLQHQADRLETQQPC